MKTPTTSTRHPRAESTKLACSTSGAAIALLLAFALVPVAHATPGTFYVDNSGEAPCSNSGPGTEAQPFCTISAAVTKVGGPGCTILVKSGTYREQVTIPVSGAPGDSFVIRAIGTVTIDGADSFERATCGKRPLAGLRCRFC